MTRRTYREELQALEHRTLALGEMVESAIVESVRILARRDREASQRLIAWDQTVNERRFALEADILALIATQQPVAGEMRALAALLEITTELERIGDYAKGIARINLLLDGSPIEPEILHRLNRMADGARDMLEAALAAFAARNPGAARRVSTADDAVDALFKEVFHALVAGVSDAEDGRQAAERANYLLWVAHNLERAADRTINICERVVYTVTGELGELSPASTASDPPEITELT